MQLPELTEIKRRRKELELSQTELAKMANISQPLLAKIEANQIQPAYDKAKRIFLALESIQTSQGLTAKQIMSKHIFAVSPKEPVKKAIQLMQKMPGIKVLIGFVIIYLIKDIFCIFQQEIG